MSSTQTAQENQAVQEAGPQPFEDWVIGAIKNTKREELNALADLIYFARDPRVARLFFAILGCG